MYTKVLIWVTTILHRVGTMADFTLGTKIFAWYMDMNGIGNKNIVKYPYLTWYQEKCEIRITYTYMVPRKDNTSLRLVYTWVTEPNYVMIYLSFGWLGDYLKTNTKKTCV